MSNDLDFVLRVLRLCENHNYLSWSFEQDGNVSFTINCSDLFWWGTSDAEEVTSENIDLLEQSFKDVIALTGKDDFAFELWASRVRRERPQGCCYPDDQHLWDLFDQCGPEREVGLGNPYCPGERQRSEVHVERYERKEYERLKQKFES